MQCLSVTQLVEHQAVCGFVMARKQFFKPTRDTDSGNMNMNMLTTNSARLCKMRGIGTHNYRWQTMRKTMNDAVHQTQQRHHEQSQGEVAAHNLSKGESEIHAGLNSVD